LSPAYFASLYKEHNLQGAHVIKLGSNNDSAALEALTAWPNNLQIGGGITIDNAKKWLDAGASKVIVTSWLFPNGKFSLDRLKQLSQEVGVERLVVDISCRRRNDTWIVAMDKWQTFTDTEVNAETIALMSQFCSEFLVHAADVEGLCQGIDKELVRALGEWCDIPCVYAGGAKDISDLDNVQILSNGKVDLTYGSALDIFGGLLVKFANVVEWVNKNRIAT
ncbi:Enzyme that catalyzes the fourth step in the histidine pathway, partial [Nowakowskiella sp. JEL0078]